MISPLSSSELCTLHGLNRAAGVLLTIFRLNRLTGEGELAGLLGLHPSTVRGHLRCLDRLGLVVRIRYHQGYGLTHGGLSLARSVDRLLQAEPGRTVDATQARAQGMRSPDPCTDVMPNTRLDGGPGAGLDAGPHAGQGVGPGTGQTKINAGQMKRMNTGYVQSDAGDALHGSLHGPQLAVSEHTLADLDQPLASGERVFPHSPSYPHSPQLAVSEHTLADPDQPLVGGERAFSHPASFPHSPQLAVSQRAPADLDQALAGLGLALAGLNAPLAQNGRSPAQVSAGERPSTTTATTTLATIFHFLWRAVVAAESLNGLSIPERPAEAQPPAARDERQDGEPVEMGQPAPAEDHPGEQGISTTAAGEALCGSPPAPHARRAAPQPRRGPRPSRPSPAGGSTPASERPSLAAQANYAALRRYGVGDNHRVRQVCALEHVTPEYIHAQAERLRSEQRLKPGLLISVVAAGDPLAEPEEDDPMRSSERARQRYAEWGQ